MPAHSATFAFAVVLCQSVFFLSGIVSPLLSRHYHSLSPKTKYQWKVKTVSQVNAYLSIVASLACYGVEELDKDRVYGWDTRVGTLCGLACGFLWDTLETIYSGEGLPFTMHGLTCLCIFGLGFRPFIAYYAPRSLIWEVSTLFLNIHWWLDKTGRTGSTAQLINGILLIGSFFFVRIVYGSYITFHFWLTLYSVRFTFPQPLLLIYFVGNGILNILNWIWLSKMLSALAKRFTSTAESKRRNGIKNAIGEEIKGDL